MKRSKSSMFTALVLLLLFVASACGGGQAQQADALMSAMQESMASVESARIIAQIDMDVEAAGMQIAAPINYEVVYFADPLRMHQTMDMEMLGIAMDMEIYCVQEGDDIVMYTSANGEWTKATVSLQEMQDQMGVAAGMDGLESFMGLTDNFKHMGTEIVNGVETERIQGAIKEKDLEKVFELANLDGASGAAGVSDDMDLSEIFKGMGDMEIIIWVNKETHQPVKFAIDMQEMITAVYKNLFSSMGMGEDIITVNKMQMVMEYRDINAAEPFEVPAAALGASAS